MKDARGYIITVLSTMIVSLGAAWFAVGSKAITEDEAKIIAADQSTLMLQKLNISVSVLISRMDSLRDKIDSLKKDLDRFERRLEEVERNRLVSSAGATFKVLEFEVDPRQNPLEASADSVTLSPAMPGQGYTKIVVSVEAGFLPRLRRAAIIRELDLAEFLVEAGLAYADDTLAKTKFESDPHARHEPVFHELVEPEEES